jgi:hypothetical protein
MAEEVEEGRERCLILTDGGLLPGFHGTSDVMHQFQPFLLGRRELRLVGGSRLIQNRLYRCAFAAVPGRQQRPRVSLRNG